MRLARAAFVLACAAGCATARNYDDPAGPIVVGPQPMAGRASSGLRVVTFNVKFARHPDRAADLLTRPGPLKDADVLVLQEMDQPGTELLARALGMSYVYVPAAVHPSSRRDFGVAILSPWALENPQKVPLPHLHRFRKMRRVAAAATVHTPGETVRVFAVHFETPFGASGRARRDQARAVAAEAAAWTGPVLIAGDFNGTGGPRELASLGYTWLTRQVHNTSGPFDLDHILVRGLCAAGEPSAAKAPDPSGASDHRPVWATIQSCANAPSGEVGFHVTGRPMWRRSQRSKSHNWVSRAE
jgi:endonuclease/exonuclease/phosphatase family metal-dependent hydrolase